MKKSFVIMCAAGMFLSSCDTVDRMNCLVNQSTESIQANSEAVAYSSAVIQQNARLVTDSSQAIEANRLLLEQETGH